MGLETGFFGRIMTSFIAFHADAGSPLMGARGPFTPEKGNDP
jgi:hypothetical protein